jgi:large subunit ribosomal protein L31
MKKGIHPQYYPDAKVTCACGRTWTTGSTKKEIRADMCSACHPFYTGEQRIVDTAGQVERFEKRLGQRREFLSKTEAKERKRAARQAHEVVVEEAAPEAAQGEGEAATGEAAGSTTEGA